MSDLGANDKPNDNGSWPGYRRLVLAELRRLSDSVTSVNAKLDQFHQEEIASMKVDIAMLKVKAGVWGASGGAVVTVGTVLLALLMGYLKFGGH